MRLKLNTIAIKPFVLIVSVIQILAGLVLGLIVTMVAILVPDEQGVAGVGAWSILVFPILNGMIGFLTSLFVVGMYNMFAKQFGGAVFEFEEVKE